MKKITLLLFVALTGMLNIANAQQILYNETFESNVAPVSDSYEYIFKPSTKAGTWSGGVNGVNIETAADDSIILRQGWGNQFNLKIRSTGAAVIIPNINVAGFPNLTLSYDFVVEGGVAAEVPNIQASVDGGTTWVTLNTVASGGYWGKSTMSIALPVATSTISLRLNPNAVHAVIFDNIKITETPAKLYSENFEADFAASGDLKTFAPSTEAGKWIGGKDLVTDLDANIQLRGDNGGWASHGYCLQMNSATGTPSAPVTISGIALTGYDHLQLSFEVQWLWWSAGEDAFGANPASEKSPGIEIQNGTGAWTALTTSVIGDFATQTLTLPAVNNTLPLNIRISPSMRYSYIINDLLLSGKAVGSTTNAIQLSDNSFKVYPNPATNYILTNNAQKVTITDLNGRLVKEAFNAEKVDVSSLAKGVYIVKVNVDGATKIGKLIKQ